MAKALVLIYSILWMPMASAALLNIIIDDLGHSKTDFQWLELPTEITFSILPNRHFSQSLAIKAQRQNRDVMLHMPMQALDGSALGQHGLEQHQSEHELKQNLVAALQGLPQATGINNHKGSLLTSDPQSMLWVMQVLKHQQLFFVDSRTHIATVAQQQAQAEEVPNLRRHVFLDHVDSLTLIQQQLQRAIQAAQRNGYAVAIGHPRRNTLLALQQLQLPKGVKLVSTQQLLSHQANQQNTMIIAKAQIVGDQNATTEGHLDLEDIVNVIE